MVVDNVVCQGQQVAGDVPLHVEDQRLVILEEVLVLVEADRQEVKQIPGIYKRWVRDEAKCRRFFGLETLPKAVSLRSLGILC